LTENDTATPGISVHFDPIQDGSLSKPVGRQPSLRASLSLHLSAANMHMEISLRDIDCHGTVALDNASTTCSNAIQCPH